MKFGEEITSLPPHMDPGTGGGTAPKPGLPGGGLPPEPTP